MIDGEKKSTDDIERLVRQAQSGDKEAFDGLVHMYERPAMQVATKILSNVQDAMEVVQEAFVSAYLKIVTLKKPSQFHVWFFRIVVNHAINQRRVNIRRLKKIRRIEYCEDKQSLSPSNSAIVNELQAAVQKAMLQLSGKEAKAISLFGVMGLSHKEVARIINCSTEAARLYVFRARRKLEVLLKDFL